MSFLLQEQSYRPYMDYSRDYTPVPVGESYAQFKLVGPYARSSPAASEPPSSLPSSVAPPPYSPTPNGGPVLVNGSINGLNGLTSRNLPNGRMLNGGGSANHSITTSSSGLRHDLIADLQQPDLTREVNGSTTSSSSLHHHHHRTSEIALKEAPGAGDSGVHTKFILPPQANMKPGTLV